MAEGGWLQRVRSLGWRTDIAVLPDAEVMVREADGGDGGYIAVAQPSNPDHFWGNFVLFPAPPRPGDLARWEAAFERELPRACRHRSFGWDTTDGAMGAVEQFADAGYDVERYFVQVAAAGDVVLPARASRDAEVRPLASDGDWAALVDLQVELRDEGFGEEEYRRFAERRAAAHRRMAERGQGAMLGAWREGELASSLGIYTAGDVAQYQLVATRERHRRQGLASLLLYEAARLAIDELGTRKLVIVAEEGYHAWQLYESVGFRVAERQVCVCRHPRQA